MCNFTLAVQERKDQPTEWFNIVAWKKLGEICGEYLSKGKQVYIEGRFHTREWEDEKGGKHKSIDIVANNMTMLGQGGDVKEKKQERREEAEDDTIPF